MTDPNEPKPGASPSRRLWVVWLLYFFQFLGIGVYFTYLNVYYRQSGLSGTQIGLINMTGSIIGVISAVIWGYISDRTGKPRLLIAIGGAGALVVAQFVPLAHSFWAFYGIACLAALMSSSLGTLVDSTTLAMLGAKAENYGRYRLGGSIGYILSTATAGFLFDRTGLGLVFPIYGLMMGLFAVTALLLPAIPIRTASPRGSRDLARMIRQPVWLLFALCVFLVWIANFAAIQYLGVSLQAMGASQSLIGIASTAVAGIELPFMAYSGWFIKRFGPVRLMLIAMVIWTVRFALLGWMKDPFWAIFINLINGPAYVFFANSAVNYANKMAPPSLAATSQGLLNSTISLAGVVSSILMGVLFDQVGPSGMFTAMAFCCLAALLVFGLGMLRNRSMQRADAQTAPPTD